MTEAEVAEFLAGHNRAGFASLNADGSVHLVPVNYTLIDDRIAFWADEGSQKVTNVRRDPRVTCLVEDGERMDDYRAVQIRGRVEVTTDEGIGRRVADGYLTRVPADFLTDAIREGTYALGRERVTVLVGPDRVVSWDHRKVPGIRPNEIGK